MGNEDLISIRTDVWIPRLFDHRIHEPIVNAILTFVIDLINSQNREWKEELVRDTFFEEVATKILQIPLAKEPLADVRVWRGRPLESSLCLALTEFCIKRGYSLF